MEAQEILDMCTIDALQMKLDNILNKNTIHTKHEKKIIKCLERIIEDLSWGDL